MTKKGIKLTAWIGEKVWGGVSGICLILEPSPLKQDQLSIRKSYVSSMIISIPLLKSNF